MKTPWGESQHVKKIAPGIFFVDTPVHGGYRVWKFMLNKMPEHLKLSDGWYEEDCEWCKVVIAFPGLFTGYLVTIANDTYNRWFNKYGHYKSNEVIKHEQPLGTM